jgi:hypothetical protein
MIQVLVTNAIAKGLDKGFEDTPVSSLHNTPGYSQYTTNCCRCCVLASVKAGVEGKKDGCGPLDFLYSCCCYCCAVVSVRKDVRKKYHKEIPGSEVMTVINADA